MLNLLAVFLGGGIGSVLRFLCNTLVGKLIYSNLYIATFFVNIIGSFILGLTYIYFSEKSGLPPHIKYAVTVGFCGGLTTFSTFSLELFSMIERGEHVSAIIYGLSSVVVCVAAVYLGVSFAKHYVL